MMDDPKEPVVETPASEEVVEEKPEIDETGSGNVAEGSEAPATPASEESSEEEKAE